MADEFDEFDGPSGEGGERTHAPHKADLGNVDDALAAGTPAAKFESIGAVVKGAIVSAEMAQQRDFMTGKPKFWDDGNPCTQILIVLQTDERSPDIDDDTGLRMLYVKKPGGMLKAIHAALGKNKLSQSIGGILAVKYTGDGTPPSKGMSPPKLYAAKFTPIGAASKSPVMPTASPDNRASAIQEFKSRVPNLKGEEAKKLWIATVEHYSGKPITESLNHTEWGIVANKIVEFGPYVKELAPTPIAADEIPF